MISFFREAAGYVFKRSLRLHSEETINLNNEGG